MAYRSASAWMKGWGKRSHHAGLKHPNARHLQSTCSLILSGAAVILILCLVAIFLRTSQGTRLPDWVSIEPGDLSLYWKMLSPSAPWTCLTFGSLLFNSATSGVIPQQNSVPAAAIHSDGTPGEVEAVASTATYTTWTISAIEALQTWYDGDEGLWLSTGWWNSANCLTVLGVFLATDGNGADYLGLTDIFVNTFRQAQETVTKTRKAFATRQDGLRIIESHYKRAPIPQNSGLEERGYNGFINDYYDDEGWWALAWIRAYDVTGTAAYLSMAESIFHDMQGGLGNATCGGGIWWNKDRTYKNAIANELYLSVAASLANRASNANAYLAVAEGQWAWFRQSGMINSNNLINDGLTINANRTCVNNGGNIWSYNQGVILGGLVELYKATGRTSFLSTGVSIAEAAISALSIDGILHDICEDDDCGADGSQFKGVFIRNLQYLQLEVGRSEFRTFILNNADSIWANDRNSSNYLGLDWAGPPSAGGGANASTQSSALDVLVAAIAVF